MNQELIEMMQDAWFILRDVLDENKDVAAGEELAVIMERLHGLIDRKLEQLEDAA